MQWASASTRARVTERANERWPYLSWAWWHAGPVYSANGCSSLRARPRPPPRCCDPPSGSGPGCHPAEKPGRRSLFGKQTREYKHRGISVKTLAPLSSSCCQKNKNIKSGKKARAFLGKCETLPWAMCRPFALHSSVASNCFTMVTI